jgi:hypothetical protein
MKRGRNQVNTLSVGDYCNTTANSRYKGLYVGRDTLGYYVYAKVSLGYYLETRSNKFEEIKSSGRHITAHAISDDEIKDVLERERNFILLNSDKYKK